MPIDHAILVNNPTEALDLMAYICQAISIAPINITKTQAIYKNYYKKYYTPVGLEDRDSCLLPYAIYSYLA